MGDKTVHSVVRKSSGALLPVEELQSHQLHTTDQKHSTKMALKGSTSAAREQALSLTGLDKRTAQRSPCSIFTQALVTTPPVTPPIKGDTPAYAEETGGRHPY